MEQATDGSLASLGGETMGTRWSVRLGARTGTGTPCMPASSSSWTRWWRR